MSADEAMTDATETTPEGGHPGDDVGGQQALDQRSGHPEVVRGGQRVIVVNSQPSPGEDDLPPRQMPGLGAVANHATDPVTGDYRRRRSSGSALLAIVVAALPVLVAALAIDLLLEDRTVVLVATAALALLWLLGLVNAWRGLGPNGRESRGAVFFGRAVGLVAGAIGAVYLLIDKVSPLL